MKNSAPFWLVVAVLTFCLGFLAFGPIKHPGRIDAVSAGPWVVERYEANHRFEFLTVDAQTGPDWTGMVAWAWRFDDRYDAVLAAAKQGGIVRPLRAVIGGQP